MLTNLQPEDYEISEKDQTVSLTEIGEAHVEQLLNMTLRDPERPEDITPEQARLYGYLEQALKAQHLYRRNKEYLVQGGKVVIVDEFTGRLMPGQTLVRRPSSGCRSQGRRQGRSRERHVCHDHLAELLPHVRKTGRHDRYGINRS